MDRISLFICLKRGVKTAYHPHIYKYLEYLLELRPTSAMTDEQLEKFAPWNATVKAACGNSEGDSLEMQN